MEGDNLEWLASLLTADNARRADGEAAFVQALEMDPSSTVHRLMGVTVNQGVAEDLRSLATVLVMRAMVRSRGQSSGTWERMTAEARAECKAALLWSLKHEPRPSLRQKTVFTASAVLGPTLAAREGWPEFFHTAVELAQSDEVLNQVTGMQVFQVIFWGLGAPAAQLVDPAMVLALSRRLLGSSEARVAVVAVDVLAATLEVLGSQSSGAALAVPGLSDLPEIYGTILGVLQRLLQAGDEEHARAVLDSLANLAETAKAPGLQEAVEPLVQAMVTVTSATSLEPDTRSLALETVVLMVQSLAQLFQSSPGVIPGLLTLIASMFSDPNTVDGDDENAVRDWMAGADDVDGFADVDMDGDDMQECAASGLDRLAFALGPEAILTPGLELHTQLAASPDWRQRRTSLLMLAILCDGCESRLQPCLPHIVPLILNATQDPHPRVRYAALFCLSELIFHGGAAVKEDEMSLQDTFHEPILNAFLQSFQDHNRGMPRLEAVTASSLARFCNPKQCEDSFVLPILEPLLQQLFERIGGSAVSVQIAVLSATAAVALVVGEAFGHYYESFMPLAKNLLATCGGAGTQTLRGITAEAIASMGSAVGKDRFCQDAHEVMPMLLHGVQGQQTSFDPEDPQSAYLLRACTRIAGTLGPDFRMYLDTLLPPVITAVESPLEVCDPRDEADESHKEVTLVQFHDPTSGLCNRAINTAHLEDKENVCRVLFQLLHDLRLDLLLYMPAIARAVLPLLDWRIHKSISTVMTALVPDIVQLCCLGLQGGGSPDLTLGFVQELWAVSVAGLVRMAQTELEHIDFDVEVLSMILDSLVDCLKHYQGSREAGVALELTRDLAILMLGALWPCQAPATVLRRTQVKEEDEDYEYEIMNSVVEATGYVIRALGPAALPLLQGEVLPALQAALQGADEDLQGNAMLTILDLVEHCGQETHGLAAQVMPWFLSHIFSSHSGLRGASTFGTGVLAQHGGEAFDAQAREALQNLWTFITQIQEDEEDEDVLAARDNAISSVLKICVFRTAQLTADEAAESMRMLLALLPLRHDLLEARAAHGLLLRLLTTASPLVLGSDTSNLPAALVALAGCMEVQDPAASGENDDEGTWAEAQLIDEATFRMSRSALETLATLPAFGASWNYLAVEQRTALEGHVWAAASTASSA